MRLDDIVSDVNQWAPRGTITATRGDLQGSVDGVAHDSRAVVANTLFCCVRGTRSDGHDHAAADAVAAGACALVVERFLDLDVTQILVPSVRRAMGPIAAAVHDHPSRRLRCTGVTGTNGKTTTTYLLEAIERGRGARTGVIGTVATRADGIGAPSRFTTPEAPELQQLLASWRDAGIESVSMEVSSHGLEQHRVDGIEFDAVCFTNLSHDHLDHHGSMDAYFDAKARLFTDGFSDRAAINGDDPWGVQLIDRARSAELDVIVFGRGASADVRAEYVVLDATGTTFVMVDERSGERHEIRSSLVGDFNVSNALAAAATARQAGVSAQMVAAGLNTQLVVPGRLEPVANDRGVTVLVDYAHTPDALANALRAVRSLVDDGGRVILVFGCGGDRDRAKRPLMGAAGANGADHVIITSDNPRSESPDAIINDVLNGIERRQHVEVEIDRRAAIRRALDHAQTGDVVLIAGKGHETGQTAAGTTVAFDDRVVAAQELAGA